MIQSTNITIDEEEITFLLALNLCKGIGNIKLKKLIEKFKNAKTIWNTNPFLLEREVNLFSLSDLKNKEILKRASDEINYIKKIGGKALHYLDKDYPPLLRHCKDAPVLLFQKGNLKFEGKRKIISIVGTRNSTPYGEKFIQKLIDDLTPHNPIIISGLAYGIDAIAHKKALENGLQTIGVLAHSLNKIYPPEHQLMAEKMQKNGALLSEYCSFEKMRKENFPLRNRIVAGLSEGLIVIESAIRGGAIISAKYANNYNREVFALPGKVNDLYSQGTNELIKTHQANLLSSAKDIEEMLGWDRADLLLSKENLKEIPDLDGKEKLIYEHLKKGKIALNQLHVDLDIPINELMTLLFNLELKDIIKSLAGKYFELKK